jgi:hypothetical protein
MSTEVAGWLSRVREVSAFAPSSDLARSAARVETVLARLDAGDDDTAPGELFEAMADTLSDLCSLARDRFEDLSRDAFAGASLSAVIARAQVAAAAGDMGCARSLALCVEGLSLMGAIATATSEAPEVARSLAPMN